MPNDPILLLIRDDLLADLDLMSKANGYHHDYQPAVQGIASYESETDYAVPCPYLSWGGDPGGQGDGAGGERPGRPRYDEQFMVSVSIKAEDGDHEGMAMRVVADVYKALIGGSPTRRERGQLRVVTFARGRVWDPDTEGGGTRGGALAMPFSVRWEHVRGDMSSA